MSFWILIATQLIEKSNELLIGPARARGESIVVIPVGYLVESIAGGAPFPPSAYESYAKAFQYLLDDKRALDSFPNWAAARLLDMWPSPDGEYGKWTVFKIELLGANGTNLT